jgi:hypothetical protein
LQARLLLAECVEAVPAALHAASVLLHDRALLNAEIDPTLQEAVARMCEAWWQAG